MISARIPALHRPAISLAALTLLALAAPAFAQSPAEPRATISVSGEAHIDIAPDMAEIEGGVTSEAKEAGAASAANAKSMAAIFETLKAAGVADKDMRTTRFAIQPIFPPKRGDVGEIIGYRASNHVRVRVRDITRAPAIIDAFVKAGANDMSGIRFAVSDPEKHIDALRSEAVRDARRKAEIYAKAAGVALGAPLSISEGGISMPQPVAYRSLAPAAAEAVIAPGEQSLRVNVSVTYQIK